MKKISLLFDLDGTLWDTSISTYEASKKVREVNLDIVKKGMGKTKEENAKLYFPDLDVSCGCQLIDEISLENVKLINDGNAKIYPGVIDTLKKLSKKYDLFIVSNSASSNYVNLILKYIDVHFVELVAAGEKGMNKEEAIGYILDKYQPDYAFYIGDTTIDRDSARANKLPFIFARYGFGDVDDYEYAINSIEDLTNIIDNFPA